MANELIKQCAWFERLFKSRNGPEDTMAAHVGGGHSIKILAASSSPLEVKGQSKHASEQRQYDQAEDVL